ncbi:MAG TPA: glycosyltransferase family A protein [Pirellulales bacterium]|nr:glycosyltransferase family A protein [Pirellulales bacterium]
MMAGDTLPILIKVWAGEGRHDLRYIRRSLPSLLASDLPDGAHVVIVDDCSTDSRLAPFLRRLAQADSRVELWTNPQRMGPNRGHVYNVGKLLERFPSAECFALCDDDVVYHPGWLQRLLCVRREAEVAGIRGVFTALNFDIRPALQRIQLPSSEVLVKERQAALNWLVPRQTYDTVGPFRDMGLAYDHDYGLRMSALGLRVVCLAPSWVQNIGFQGAYQSDNSHWAKDYVGKLGLGLRAHYLAWTLRGYGAGAILLARGAGRRLQRSLRRSTGGATHR